MQEPAHIDGTEAAVSRVVEEITATLENLSVEYGQSEFK